MLNGGCPNRENSKPYSRKAGNVNGPGASSVGVYIVRQ
jgi:hypothetical protein